MTMRLLKLQQQGFLQSHIEVLNESMSTFIALLVFYRREQTKKASKLILKTRRFEFPQGAGLDRSQLV